MIRFSHVLSVSLTPSWKNWNLKKDQVPTRTKPQKREIGVESECSVTCWNIQDFCTVFIMFSLNSMHDFGDPQITQQRQIRLGAVLPSIALLSCNLKKPFCTKWMKTNHLSSESSNSALSGCSSMHLLCYGQIMSCCVFIIYKLSLYVISYFCQTQFSLRITLITCLESVRTHSLFVCYLLII